MKDALKELFPPDVPPILKWRLVMFVFVMFFLFFISWAGGGFERIGLGAGFALASDLEEQVKEVKGEVKELKEDMSEINVQLIEQGIYTAKESECTATDPVARRFFASRVQALSRQYEDITDVRFNIPPCRSGE